VSKRQARWRVAIGVQAVRRRIPVETDDDEVRDSHLSGTEVGKRVDPALRKLERKRYPCFVAGLGREDDTELGDAGRIDAEAVETVGDINYLSLSL
jgi:hypothetical protein